MKRPVYFLMIAFTMFSCSSQTLELNKPESIAATGDFLYVSNVNGDPGEKDGNGYISKLYKDGKVCNNKFITGLDAPKGIVIVHDTLYVTDIDKVLGFELIHGKKVFECSIINKAHFLNDICYDDNGHLYVSSTDINEIFEINIDNKSLRLLGLADRLNGPNGLVYHNGLLYVCESNRSDTPLGTVKSIEIGKDSIIVTPLMEYKGYLDGLAFYDNKLYFSDWVSHTENGKSKIMVFDLDTKQCVPVKTNENMTGCADIFLDEKNKVIIAPLMMENKILFVSL